MDVNYNKETLIEVIRNESNGVYPFRISYGALAKKTNLSRSVVVYTIRQLTRSGILGFVQGKKGKEEPNGYTIRSFDC